MVQAAADADILIFVVPHQFIRKICDQLKGHLKANAIGVSLIKVPGTSSCGWRRDAANCCGVRAGEERRTKWQKKAKSFLERGGVDLGRLRNSCWGPAGRGGWLESS